MLIQRRHKNVYNNIVCLEFFQYNIMYENIYLVLTSVI